MTIKEFLQDLQLIEDEANFIKTTKGHSFKIIESYRFLYNCLNKCRELQKELQCETSILTNDLDRIYIIKLELNALKANEC